MSVYKVGSARKPTGNLVSFVGEVGDLFYSIDDSRLRISDGATPGGTLLSTGGTITGDVTATTVNATTVDLGDWTITGESGSLLFATQGVTKMKLDPAGNLDVVGNINCTGDIFSSSSSGFIGYGGNLSGISIQGERSNTIINFGIGSNTQSAYANPD